MKFRTTMLHIALALALVLRVAPALASQATLVTPPAPLPMSSLATFLNAAFLSIGSCNSGASAPANGTGGAAFVGECWINTTTGTWVFSIYDGTNWDEFGSLDTSTHVWTGYSLGALLGSMANQSASSVAITGGTITGLPTPTNNSDAATKGYVDNAVIGIVVHPSVNLATATTLPANTYDNGTDGVGATLTSTCSSSCPAPTVDGSAVTSGQRVLVKNEAAPANNGIYVVTTVGTGTTKYVLTRATDADVAGTNNPTKIGIELFALVGSGTVNAGSGWLVTSSITTIGTDAINWAQFTSAITGVSSLGGLNGVISLGTGLSISGNTINTPWTCSGGNCNNNNAGTITITNTNNGGNLIVSGTSNNQGIQLNNTGSGGIPWNITSTDSGSGLGAGNLRIYTASLSTP